MRTVFEPQAEFKSKRVQRFAVFKVNAPVQIVFPLFGPMKEKLWAAGWEPEIIYSTTNDVEEHMVFKTNSGHGESEPYLWVINQYKPEEYLVEYMVSTSVRIWFITVYCEPAEASTKVKVTYSYTGLTPEGNRLNEIAIEKMYARNLTDWEEAINHYLKTGKQLSN